MSGEAKPKSKRRKLVDEGRVRARDEAEREGEWEARVVGEGEVDVEAVGEEGSEVDEAEEEASLYRETNALLSGDPPPTPRVPIVMRDSLPSPAPISDVASVPDKQSTAESTPLQLLMCGGRGRSGSLSRASPGIRLEQVGWGLRDLCAGRTRLRRSSVRKRVVVEVIEVVMVVVEE